MGVESHEEAPCEAGKENRVEEDLSQKSITKENLVDRGKSKLERLLAQPDIFETLRRINTGEIKGYDQLEEPCSQMADPKA